MDSTTIRMEKTLGDIKSFQEMQENAKSENSWTQNQSSEKNMMLQKKNKDPIPLCLQFPWVVASCNLLITSILLTFYLLIPFLVENVYAMCKINHFDFCKNLRTWWHAWPKQLHGAQETKDRERHGVSFVSPLPKTQTSPKH